MAKRALYSIVVGGQDATSTIAPLLTALTVSLRAGDEGDAAVITLDDTAGQIEMPETGAAIQVALGWSGEGQQVVFDGTVDEVISVGSREGGTTLSVTAKGFSSDRASKDKARRHWDDATVENILKDAASAAGVGTVRVDPNLSGITLKYWAMDDESFLHMGRRLAAKIGGDFQVQGEIAQMARRGAAYSPTVTVAKGETLHDWSLAPILGRKIYGKVIAPYFDRSAGAWKQVEVETGLNSSAVLKITPPANDEEDAQRQATAQAETCKRAAGGGEIGFEGTTAAVPDGMCRLTGARPGIDGNYRVLSVEHTLSRGSGWVTRARLGHPEVTSSETAG